MDMRIPVLIAGVLFAAGAHGFGADMSGVDPGYEEPADTQAKAAENQFTEMDRNGDGALSKQEAVGNQRLANDWDLADRNRDGQLDRAEFSRFEQRMNGIGTPARR